MEKLTLRLHRIHLYHARTLERGLPVPDSCHTKILPEDWLLKILEQGVKRDGEGDVMFVATS